MRPQDQIHYQQRIEARPGSVKMADPGPAMRESGAGERVAQAALGALGSVTDAVARDYFRNQQCRVDDSTARVSAEFEQWKQNYYRTRQGVDAATAEADFTAKWDELANSARENFHGSANEIFQHQFEKNLDARRVMAIRDGGGYQRQQTEAWEKSVWAGKRATFNQQCSAFADDPERMDYLRRDMLQSAAIMNPGMDLTALDIELRQEMEIGRLSRWNAEGKYEQTLEALGSGLSGGRANTRGLAPEHERMARDAARAAGIPEELALAVIMQESGGDPRALSKAGAIGLMQLMPGTAKDYGVDPNDVAQNLKGGMAHLRMLHDKYGGNWEDALSAYNWGHGNYDNFKKNGGPRPKENAEYYRKVMGRMAGGKSVADLSAEGVGKYSYRYGAKGNGGNIDCSGWVNKTGVAHLLQSGASQGAIRFFEDAIRRGGAAGAIEQIGKETGKLLVNDQIWQAAEPGMLIGLSTGGKAKGRYEDIGHIAQVFEKGGQLWVTESSRAAGGVKETPLNEFYQEWRNKDVKLTAVSLNDLNEKFPGAPAKGGSGGFNPASWLEPAKQMQLYHQAQAGLDRQAAELRVELQTSLANFDAQCRQGFVGEFGMDTERMIKAAGKDAPELIAHIEDMRELGAAIGSIKTMRLDQMESFVKSFEPKQNDKRYSERMKRYNEIQNFAKGFQSALAKDPVMALMQVDDGIQKARAELVKPNGLNKETWAAYSGAVKSALESRGFGGQPVLSQADAQYFASQIENMVNPHDAITRMADACGADFPAVADQVMNKCSAETQVLANGMDPNDVRLYREAAKQGDPKKWDGKDFIDYAKQRLKLTGADYTNKFEGALNDALAQFDDTLLAGVNSKMGQGVRNVTRLLALQLALADPACKGNIARAAQMAAERVILKGYSFSPNINVDGTRRGGAVFRIPKRGGFLDDSKIAQGAADFLEGADLTGFALEYERGQSTELQREQMVYRIRNEGYFVTNEDETGLRLFVGTQRVLGKDGEAINFKWEQLPGFIKPELHIQAHPGIGG